MNLFSLAHTKRAARSRALSIALATVALACLTVIEALHDHACEGDGCILCLIATCAYVLLGLCIGITAARPIVRALADTQFTHAVALPVPVSASLLHAGTPAKRTVQTPVTRGVKLRI